MAYAPSELVDCQILQAQLEDYFSTCKARPPAPFYNFMWSDINRGTMQQVLNPVSGKKRTVELIYDQPLLESEVVESDNCSLTCVATTKRGNLSKTYSIDCDGLMVEELIDPEDWISICHGNRELLFRKIKNLMDGLMERQATDLVSQAEALMGRWGSDVTVNGSFQLVVNTMVTGTAATTQTPNPIALVDIDQAIERSNFCNGAVIFGSTDLERLYKLLMIGCCNTTLGIDADRALDAYGKVLYYDRRVFLETGGQAQNISWVVSPGALQPIYWTFNNNGVLQAANEVLGIPNGNFGANYLKGVIYDDITGAPVDFLISDNCGAISIIMKSTQKLVSLPTDMYPTGHQFDGVTGIAAVKVTNS